MFKTERDNILDSRYGYNKEPVQSRYMINSKKKYYLASVDHNLNQLKDEQLHSLTELLIELKSEYDELIRELKKMDNQNTMFRLVNIYNRLFFDTLKKNNSSLIKIFKIIFPDEKINEEKTNSFLNKWFENNKKDTFNLNICKDYKNFLIK